jgi:hypothetical protein
MSRHAPRVEHAARRTVAVTAGRDGQLYRIVPSMLTAIRCDDLSICTTTSARAGVSANPDSTIAAANASLASRPPGSRFMIAPAI